MRLFVAVGLIALTLSQAHAAYFPPRLFLSSDGIALSSFPNRTALRQTVVVGRTRPGAQASWVARSNQSWLFVTPSGVTGGSLTVLADPSGLKYDQLYVATVKVSAVSFYGVETLRVGFWRGSASTQTVLVPQNAFDVATNPVEPLAYVSDGDTNIYAYNVYSGALVATIGKVAPTVGSLAVSSDGRTIFATDTTNYAVVAVDADSGAILSRYGLGYSLDYGFNIVFARPYGHPAIYASGGPIIGYPSAQKIGTGLPAKYLAVTPDGLKVFAVEAGVSPGTLFNYAIAPGIGGLSVNLIGSAISKGSNCTDLAVSWDGSHLYPACGAPYEFDVYDGSTLRQVQTLPAVPYPDSAFIDSNDEFIGGVSALYDSHDVFAFEQGGTLIGSLPTTTQSYGYGQQSATLRASGDSTRVVSATAAVYKSHQTLMFRDLP